MSGLGDLPRNDGRNGAPHPIEGTNHPAELVDRLGALPHLEDLHRSELEWLASHGRVEAFDVGDVIAPKDERIENLWVILSGRMAVWVDRGMGPRLVMSWLPGDVSGLLPYSRMKGPPGPNSFMERSEILVVHERHFPEMVHRCPAFTAHTVHLMLDRARTFNSSALLDEKMVSLGKLAAGLAHELNNPASATVRSAKLLRAGLSAADEASRALGASALTAAQLRDVETIRERCLAEPPPEVRSPIQRVDREDEIVAWLVNHDVASRLAIPLAETAVTVDDLDRLADTTSGGSLGAVVRWIAEHCSMRSLATDIEEAATRIHDLVAAVKRFTYVDHLAAPERVVVETGLRDTIRMVTSKAKSKRASIDLTVPPELPPVRANGGELNQVWMNLLDNALDAIPDGGHVEVTARAEGSRVVVRFVDDGSGITPETLPRIFDPFFTTKPPGQGTGLGLDLTRRLLRRFRGDVSVESRPGRTEFRVSLMLADDRETSF